MRKSWPFALIAIFILNSCDNQYHDFEISIHKSKISENIFKIDFIIENKSSGDFFIPYFKPVGRNLEMTDVMTSYKIPTNYDPSILLSEKEIKRKDLIESAQIDSFVFNDLNDSIIYYFNLTVAKEVYDSIIRNYSNKNEIKYIYPFFYHSIYSQCIYIRSGENKKISFFYYYTEPVSVRLQLNYCPDSIEAINEDYFNAIPPKIGSFLMYKNNIVSKNFFLDFP